MTTANLHLIVADPVRDGGVRRPDQQGGQFQVDCRLHRQPVRVLPPGRTEDQAKSRQVSRTILFLTQLQMGRILEILILSTWILQLPRHADSRVPVLHHAERTWPQEPRPRVHEEARQQGQHCPRHRQGRHRQ